MTSVTFRRAAKHRMAKFPNLALSRVFRKVNHYVLKRMARFLNRKSQRYYRLKFADAYYGEMTHYGLCRLVWADVRRNWCKRKFAAPP